MSCSLLWWVLHAQSSINSHYPTPTLVQHYQHCKQWEARACPDKKHRITNSNTELQCKSVTGNICCIEENTCGRMLIWDISSLAFHADREKNLPLFLFSSHLFAFLFSMKVAVTFIINLCHQTLQMDVSPLQTCFNILCAHCPYKYAPRHVRE